MAREISSAPRRARARRTESAAADAGPPTTKGIEAKRRIIAVAESVFTRKGFEGASMRDIAAEANMQAASMYYYFPSKEELLWAVWEKGGRELIERARSALQGKTDPWERMEAACIAHVAGLLLGWRNVNQVLFIMPPWQYPENIRDRVIALRDEYEEIFIGLIDELPLRRGVDRHRLRLTLIGALSWPLFWYKPGRDKPAVIGRQILNLLRKGVEA